MEMDKLNIIKGIHPSIILDRELKNRNLSIDHLATLVAERVETIGDVICNQATMTQELSHKIELALELEKGLFATLQVYYNEREAQRSSTSILKPDISIIRKGIFWDTDFQEINWIESKSSIIKRVFERGNEQEIIEIIRFYGKADIEHALSRYNGLFCDVVAENITKYIF